MSFINSGQADDLRKLAAGAGIEFETAEQIADQIEKKVQQSMQK